MNASKILARRRSFTDRPASVVRPGIRQGPQTPRTIGFPQGAQPKLGSPRPPHPWGAPPGQARKVRPLEKRAARRARRGA